MESPKINGNTPETSQRPTEQDFESKIYGYMQTKKVTPFRYQEIVYELQDFANGEGDQDIRSQYYKGWADEDFKEILKKLEEK